jgi:hypothetical protein
MVTLRRCHRWKKGLKTAFGKSIAQHLEHPLKLMKYHKLRSLLAIPFVRRTPLLAVREVTKVFIFGNLLHLLNLMVALSTTKVVLQYMFMVKCQGLPFRVLH